MVADTLGAINSPVEYLQGKLTGTSVTIDKDFKAFTVDPSTISGTLKYQIENGYCRFIANTDGIYSLNWGRCYASELIAGARLVTSVYDKFGTKISEVIGLGWVDSRYVENAMSTFTGYLTKDQYILLGVYDRSVTLSDSVLVFNKFTFVRHEISMPYIIANKGALVSGGAFQFDADGHGYTDNYSFDEVKVGTWVDGRDLYKKTFSWDSFKTTWNYLDADAPFAENWPNSMVKVEFWGMTSYYTYQTITVIKSNYQNIWLSYPDTSISTGTFFAALFTAYYTK
jgi:hypothetical protein